MTLRVLCFGGRAFFDAAKVNHALQSVLRANPAGIACMIHGGARGADTLCGEWAIRHGVPVLQVDANWAYYGRTAGPVRNAWMLEFCAPNYAVGFPGGAGSADMRRRLVTAGIPIFTPYGEDL